jgi:4-amino-4-deoxy-L-arabinose transferase-like glycosyltransferase
MSRYESISLGLLLVLAAFIYTTNIDSPFLQHMQSQGTLYGQLARNFLTYGYNTLRFGPSFCSGPLEYYKDHHHYYHSVHPFLPIYCISLSFWIFGVCEWALTLPFIIFALAGIALFHHLARYVLTPKAALIATVIFALNPMYAYMSVVTVHQVGTLFFALAAVYLYLRWVDNRKIWYLLGVGVSMLFACNMDWPGYYTGALLFVYHLFVVRQRVPQAWIFLVINLVIFGLYLVHLYILDPQGLTAINRLFEAGQMRSIFNLDFTPPQYVYRELREIGLYFTIPVVLMAAVGFLRILFTPKTKQTALILCLMILGLDELTFIQICYEHDYYSYYLVVSLCLLAVDGWGYMFQKLGRRGIAILFSFILLAGFLIQSTLVLRNRYYKVGAYEFYYKMAGAIRNRTLYRDKVLILLENIIYYTPFYADRYYMTYDPKAQMLLETNMGRFIPGITLDKLKELLQENKIGFKYAVTTTKELVLPEVSFLRGLPDHILRKFYIEVGDPSPLYLFLKQRYPCEAFGGFLFFLLGS